MHLKGLNLTNEVESHPTIAERLTESEGCGYTRGSGIGGRLERREGGKERVLENPIHATILDGL